ncbi:uncharacterized protein LOC127282401 [Leptopilina boulardi]|uniref:uncharacterized protein LOC127282401 n=1 Tax=Leptopilina boulardi TaxID=63433 RepID=UPI0021F65F21|nr:uncharacterized protein LOC127282401 [Leptopilina boulardi]
MNILIIIMEIIIIIKITSTKSEFPNSWFNNYHKRNNSKIPIAFLSEDIDDNYYDENGNILHDLNRRARDSMREYKNLCATVTRRVEFEDSIFEYQPPHYHEIFCKNHAPNDGNFNSIQLSQQKCAHPGFDCVQRSRTIFMVRRKWENDCWEPFTKEIASGCDCMWPVLTLGDISIHY